MKVKCFSCLGHGHIASQCPNKRFMIVDNKGNLYSDSEGGNEGENEAKQKHDDVYEIDGYEFY